MVTSEFRMVVNGVLADMVGQQNRRDKVSAALKEVPIQVMVPKSVRRQVALMGAERGENIRTVVLRGLRAIGVDIPDSELIDRRGRRRNGEEGGDGEE
jgi:hypothetical protein